MKWNEGKGSEEGRTLRYIELNERRMVYYIQHYTYNGIIHYVSWKLSRAFLFFLFFYNEVSGGNGSVKRERKKGMKARDREMSEEKWKELNAT